MCTHLQSPRSRMGSVKRMSALDICAMVREINETALNMKLMNVYSISGKTYLLKLSGKVR